MSVIILRADAARLPLPDASVDLIATSPPYWGQREYRDGGAALEGQIGAEETPGEYIAALLGCTREWMRVLKPEGSLFVNLGDKYATRYSSIRGAGRAGLNDDDDSRGRSGQNRTGAPEKSLLGLPWRYAIGCMDQLGLTLRAEIVWDKPNGLPESVTDRVRRSHEQVFHLVKQPRYFAAVDEIRQPHTSGAHGAARAARSDKRADAADRWSSRHAQTDYREERNHSALNPLGALPGSVWEIASQPLMVPAHLGVDHFAAFPMELPRRIILGWSPSGVCTACGEGRRPVVSSVRMLDGEARNDLPAWADPSAPRRAPAGVGHGRFKTDRQHLGYACACPDASAPTRPALVADPFGGTGTTALVADALGRTGVTIDRSADYCRIAAWRTSDPAERARALGVAKPPPVIDGQGSLFDGLEAS